MQGKTCVATLQLWLAHLDMVYTDFVESLKCSSTPKERTFAQEFDLSKGELTTLKDLLCKMLEAGTSLEIIKGVLQVSPVENWNLSVVVQQTTQKLVDSLRWEKYIMK